MRATIIPQAVPAMPRKPSAPDSSVSFFALLCILLLCVGTADCGDSCVSGIFNPPNSMVQVKTCSGSLSISNGTVRVSLRGSAPTAQMGSFAFRHINVTISGVEVSSVASPVWREITPALRSKPVQLDLLEGGTDGSDEFGRVSLGEASIPPGDYTAIRLRLAGPSTELDLLLEGNRCRDVGANCAVAWDGAIRPLALDLSAPEIGFAPVEIAGGVLRVLPDASTRLDMVFNAAGSRAVATGDSLRLAPVFDAE
jgi:Domain of unknown function (DUF4382)